MARGWHSGEAFLFPVLLDAFLDSKTEMLPSAAVDVHGVAKEDAEGSWENRDRAQEKQGKGILVGGEPELTGCAGYQETNVGTSAVFNPGQLLETLAGDCKILDPLVPPPTCLIRICRVGYERLHVDVKSNWGDSDEKPQSRL